LSLDKPFASGAFQCYNSPVIRFQRRFFPERRYRLPLRWVLWGAIVVMGLGFVLFVRFLFR
jgi:hypothetical protein